MIGVLPCAGTGSRLGLPFHKSLAPLPENGGLVTLASFAEKRLRTVCDTIVHVVTEPVWGLPGEQVLKRQRGELPSSLRTAAEAFPDSVMAVDLPDTIWTPPDGFRALAAAMSPGLDGVLGIFAGDSRELDQVWLGVAGVVVDVALHDSPDAKPRRVHGWGCLVATSRFLSRLTDDEPLAPQLARGRFVGVQLGDDRRDLGTPDRYIAEWSRRLGKPD